MVLIPECGKQQADSQSGGQSDLYRGFQATQGDILRPLPQNKYTNKWKIIASWMYNMGAYTCNSMTQEVEAEDLKFKVIFKLHKEFKGQLGVHLSG